MVSRTDHSFHIGEQHLRQGKPCQDYALSGILSDNIAYAIVADGCSSGEMTDIGSRLGVLATKQALVEQYTKDSPKQIAIKAARDAYLRSWQHSLNLGMSDLLATNLFVAGNTSRLTANIAGDGVLVTRKVGVELIARKYEWQDNMPFYPAYNFDLSIRSDFINHHGALNPSLKIETWDLSQEKPRLLEEETMSTAQAVLEVFFHDSIPNLPNDINFYDMAAVFSDGVMQVDGWDWQDVVKELVAFKSTKGQFAVRRLNRFLQKARKEGRGPIDDIAYSVINLYDMKGE